MRINIGSTDRAARLVLGVVALAVGIHGAGSVRWVALAGAALDRNLARAVLSGVLAVADRDRSPNRDRVAVALEA